MSMYMYNSGLLFIWFVSDMQQRDFCTVWYNLLKFHFINNNGYMYMPASGMCKAPVSDPILEKYVNLKEFI